MEDNIYIEDCIGIYDILYILIKRLDVVDIINLMLTNKKFYSIYLSNSVSINKILVEKIFKYFRFDNGLINNTIKKIFNEGYEKNSICDISRIMCKTYNYFKRHLFCYKCDFVIFMLDNNISSDILFDFYISSCRFLSYINQNNTIRTIRYNEIHDIFYFETQASADDISVYDMEYILEHSNYNQLKIILEKFNIPITMIHRNISCWLAKVVEPQVESTINLCIDYIFYRHCFGEISNFVKKNINYIMDTIIYYKNTDILIYFLQKKNYYMYNDILDYQYIINRCIIYEDKRHLELLMNDKEKYCGTNNSLIIINHNIIKNLCKRGSFNYLKYIIETLLGVYINSNLYIESICDGIRENPDKLKSLKDLYVYFTNKNKTIIDETINRLINK